MIRMLLLLVYPISHFLFIQRVRINEVVLNMYENTAYILRNNEWLLETAW